MAGKLLGIARKGKPRGEVETIDHAHVGLATGVAGDFRGSIRPGKSNKRQVTLIACDDWTAAMADLGSGAAGLDWSMRRANLLIDGIELPREIGARVRIGDDVLLEISGECDPCSRMEEIAVGLKGALLPDWRGGRLTRVIVEGEIRIGDRVAIEEMN